LGSLSLWERVRVRVYMKSLTHRTEAWRKEKKKRRRELPFLLVSNDYFFSIHTLGRKMG
jgi:hypothetical protein